MDNTGERPNDFDSISLSFDDYLALGPDIPPWTYVFCPRTNRVEISPKETPTPDPVVASPSPPSPRRQGLVQLPTHTSESRLNAPVLCLPSTPKASLLNHSPSLTELEIEYPKETRWVRAMADANRLLVGKSTRHALKMYTNILSENPGHVPAFLNRSLCYIVLGFPHLATYDAFRALVTLDYITNDESDPFNGRAHIWNLHLYVTLGDPEVDTWLEGQDQFIGGGSIKPLNMQLASVRLGGTSMLLRHRPQQSFQGPLSREKTTEFLLRESRFQAYFRLVVALWKCGGGAIQSAIDQICRATEDQYVHTEDMEQFQHIHNEILCELEPLLREDDGINLLRKQKGLNPLPSGIRELLKCRFTKLKREIYPWDTCSLTWSNKADEFGYIMNEAISTSNEILRYRLEPDVDMRRPPRLILTANVDIPASEVLLIDRSINSTVYPKFTNAHSCTHCGTLLDLTDNAIVEARKHAEKRKKFLMHRAFEARHNLKLAVKCPNLPQPRVGYQMCHWCEAPFCGVVCRDRAMVNSFHTKLCPVSTQWHNYNVELPDPWSIPSPLYLKLLHLTIARVIAKTDAYPLEELWIKSMHGQLANPSIKSEVWHDFSIPIPEEDALSGSIKSMHINELYPDRMTLGQVKSQLTSHRADSKVDEEISDLADLCMRTSSDAEMTDAPDMMQGGSDQPPTHIMWSFESNVIQVVRLLAQIPRGDDPVTALLNALDLGWDGWILETLRAKVDAHLSIQTYPRTVKSYDEQGNLVENDDIERPDLPYQGGYELLDPAPHAQYIGSLRAFSSCIPKAGPGEAPNVRFADRDGKFIIKTSKMIGKGQRLCQ
ncbi:hypothetical protein B0J11DRAFT_229521 [Dendryphion nanum]|uniref:Uncharacterized protein n=1 Tax=Dendryphion nanum TaxID=256645 RepID=A0A9P9E8B7_9PLEO|nr:hypothetical protein B0J11DRAFT_229521 [Dendryphion nanum]